jgi:hypothetical protein
MSESIVQNPQRLAPQTSRWFAIGFFLLLVMASTRFAVLSIWQGNLAEAERYVLYQAATLSFNYFEFGAIRRGLGGSLVHVLSSNTAAATLAFHFITATAVASTAALLFYRRPLHRTVRGALILTMLTVMLRWGDDGGRIDMAVAFLFGCTAIAFQRGRPALGAAFVAVGLFVHETSFIFGLPLLAGLTVQHGGWSALPRRQRLAGVAALAAALLIYCSMGWLPHADVPTMVSAVRAKFASHEHVEWALYYALSGMRGVRTSICQNLTDPTYWVHATSGLFVIAAFGLAVLPNSRRFWTSALLAALPGFVFLAVVANDASRWAMFACFNVWLIAVASPAMAVGRAPHVALRLFLALAIVPLILFRPSSINYRIYAPSPLLENAVRTFGGPPTPSVEQALERCDPTWADVMNRP